MSIIIMSSLIALVGGIDIAFLKILNSAQRVVRIVRLDRVVTKVLGNDLVVTLVGWLILLILGIVRLFSIKDYAVGVLPLLFGIRSYLLFRLLLVSVRFSSISW
jgi:hypothetical protein